MLFRSLLALSASSMSKDRLSLTQTVTELELACRPRNIAIALGGEGQWPDVPRFAMRFRDFPSFHRYAAALAEGQVF